LDDLELQNKSFFCKFSGNFKLLDTFQERIGPKSIELDMDKLLMKFSVLNVDFDGPSLGFLGSREPAHEGIKQQYPVKVVILPLLIGQSFVQIGMGMLPITTSTNDELFSRIKIDDFERPSNCKK